MSVQRLFVFLYILKRNLKNNKEETLRGLQLTRETPPGECSRKVKLKGIDGGLYNGWSMWFNSNTAQNLTNFCIGCFAQLIKDILRLKTLICARLNFTLLCLHGLIQK